MARRQESPERRRADASRSGLSDQGEVIEEYRSETVALLVRVSVALSLTLCALHVVEYARQPVWTLLSLAILFFASLPAWWVALRSLRRGALAIGARVYLAAMLTMMGAGFLLSPEGFVHVYTAGLCVVVMVATYLEDGLQAAGWAALGVLVFITALTGRLLLPLPGIEFGLFGSILAFAVPTFAIASIVILGAITNRHLRRALYLSELSKREIRRSNDKLARATAAAEAANAAKSQFLANMSHELRTPLNAVIGYSELLAEDARDAGQTGILADLERIRSAGTHLMGLINNILDLSKIEAGKESLLLERFDVAAMIDGLVTTMEPIALRSSNKIVTELADDLGLALLDEVKLRQALVNLIGNACKFTDHGVITVRGRRERGPSVDWIELAVIDTGIGISEADQGAIFELFAQADNSSTRRFEGTGLGLTLTRRFCEMMGGSITVTSQPGQGSTFTIRLPADIPNLVAAAAAEANA